MKKIAFDLRCLPADGSAGAGIAHASRELWRACVERSGCFNVECHAFVEGEAFLFETKHVHRLAQSQSSSSLRKTFVKELRKEPYQGLLAPTGSVPLGVSIPSFPWVHDVAIFDHPDWFPQSFFQRLLTTELFLRGLRRSPKIFCVSEDTKLAVGRLIGSARAEDLIVTQEGVEGSKMVVPESQRLEQALILGTVEPRKNIPFIIELWPEVCRRLGRSIELVIAGKDGWGEIKIPERADLRRIPNLNDERRDEFLGQSKLVLVPSLHEGFGRVALEAMAMGTPLVASRVGAHTELVGDGGKLLDPTDREGWIRACVSLLSDPNDWLEAQKRGRAKAREFNWNRVADRILAGINNNC